MRSLMLFFLFAVHTLDAQIEVNININGFAGDTIWIGKYFGKRMVKGQPLLKSKDHIFQYKAEAVTNPGLFNIVFSVKGDGTNRGFPIVINDRSKQFSVHCQVMDPVKTMIITGSDETSLYVQYSNKMDELLDAYAKAVDTWRVFLNDEKFQLLYEIEKQIGDYQSALSQNQPGTFVASVIKMTTLNVPHPSGSLDEKIKKRQNYFDQSFRIEPLTGNELFWSCPQSILWMDLYAIRSHDKDIQTAIARVKRLLDYLAPNTEAYHYYIHYLLNSFLRMSRNNLDQIYVALVRDYVEKGKTPWMSEEEITKHAQQAIAIDRTRVGAKAPEIRLYKEDNSPLSLSEITSPFTLLVFWAPDCSHCKRELPLIKSMLEKYKNRHIQMVTVCNKLGEALPACFEYMKTNFLHADWINLGDKNNIAHASSLYNVTGTPCVYLLDAKKNIVYRRKGEMEDYEWDNLFSGIR